ncbi:MAG: hypothetical protein DI535_00795 [Citrobacter freundii]|nr:MAG: hypothetical protein DI535_00795 [Citrobacter freundii]
MSSKKFHNLDQFGFSLIVCILIPLMPLLASIKAGGAAPNEWILTAALLPMALFIQSRSMTLMGCGIATLTFFAYCLGKDGDHLFALGIAQVSICLFSVAHAIERFVYHVVRKEKFLQFKY